VQTSNISVRIESICLHLHYPSIRAILKGLILGIETFVDRVDSKEIGEELSDRSMNI
jgi:hypothetical protein